MAFSKKEKKEFIDYMFKSSYDSSNMEGYINDNIIIINENITLDIFKVYVDNDIYCNCDDFHSLKKLYEVIVYDDESYQIFLKMIPNFLENSNIKIDRISILNALFKNKNYILKIMEQVKNINNNDNFDYIYEYILKSRKYYIDETAYFTSIMELIEIIKKDNYITKEKLQKYIDEGLSESKKIAGIYPINEELLESFSNRITELQQKISDLEYQEQTLSRLVSPMLEDVKTTIESADKQNIEMLRQMKKYSINLQQEMRILKNDMGNNEYTDENSNNVYLDSDKLREYANRELPKIYKYIRNEYSENITDYVNEEVIIDKIVELLKDNHSLELQENKIKELSYYVYADYNNNLDIYFAIIKNKAIDEIEYGWFNSKNSEIFSDNKDLYINIILNNDSAINDALSNADKLNVLKQLYSINPNVKLTFSVSKLMNAINYFNINDIATNELIINNLYKIDPKYFKYYKEIYDINPNYEINSYYTILIPNNIFTMEEMAEFNLIQQHVFTKIVEKDCLKTNKYDSYKDIIRNIVYYNNLNEENINDCIENSTIYLLNQTGLSIDELLNLSDDEYKNILNIYKESHKYVGDFIDLISRNNSKQKLKKMKKKNIRKK